jgi:hypothetical protein
VSQKPESEPEEELGVAAYNRQYRCELVRYVHAESREAAWDEFADSIGGIRFRSDYVEIELADD